VLLAVSSSAFADFTGRVAKVSDGDTLTVLVNKTQVRVRLDAIDAPERGQTFGCSPVFQDNKGRKRTP
jgi:endonuclease YncB( thermonuclease family)